MGAPLPTTFSQLLSVDRPHGFLKFEANPISTKKDLFSFGLVANTRHHQTAGPLPSAFTQLMCVDMLHGLLEFGAAPFVLSKANFPSFWCGCKEVPSPDGGSTAKHIQPVTAL